MSSMQNLWIGGYIYANIAVKLSFPSSYFHNLLATIFKKYISMGFFADLISGAPFTVYYVSSFYFLSDSFLCDIYIYIYIYTYNVNIYIMWIYIYIIYIHIFSYIYVRVRVCVSVFVCVAVHRRSSLKWCSEGLQRNFNKSFEKYLRKNTFLEKIAGFKPATLQRTE